MQNICRSCSQENPPDFEFCRACNTRLGQSGKNIISDISQVKVSSKTSDGNPVRSECYKCKNENEHIRIDANGSGRVKCRRCGIQYHIESFKVILQGGKNIRDVETGQKEFNPELLDRAGKKKRHIQIYTKSDYPFRENDDITIHRFDEGGRPGNIASVKNWSTGETTKE